MAVYIFIPMEYFAEGETTSVNGNESEEQNNLVIQIYNHLEEPRGGGNNESAAHSEEVDQGSENILFHESVVGYTIEYRARSDHEFVNVSDNVHTDQNGDLTMQIDQDQEVNNEIQEDRNNSISSSSDVRYTSEYRGVGDCALEIEITSEENCATSDLATQEENNASSTCQYYGNVLPGEYNVQYTMVDGENNPNNTVFTFCVQQQVTTDTEYLENQIVTPDESGINSNVGCQELDQAHESVRENNVEESYVNDGLNTESDQQEVSVENMNSNYEKVSYDKKIIYYSETLSENNDNIYSNVIDGEEICIDIETSSVEGKNQDKAQEVCENVIDGGEISEDNRNVVKVHDVYLEATSSTDENEIDGGVISEDDSNTDFEKEESGSDKGHENYIYVSSSDDEETLSGESSSQSENSSETNIIDGGVISDDDDSSVGNDKQEECSQNAQEENDYFSICDSELFPSDDEDDYPRETDSDRKKRMRRHRHSRYTDKYLNLTPTRGRNIDAPPKKIFLMGPKRLF